MKVKGENMNSTKKGVKKVIEIDEKHSYACIAVQRHTGDKNGE